MQPHERVTQALKSANEAGRTALVPFITAGYPEMSSFAETTVSIATAGDVVEIGVPFSDPMADGMTIQRSSHAAIENGVTLTWILDELTRVAERIDAPLVLMSYVNPLLSFGYEALAERAANAGVGAFIVPDLPLEEAGPLRSALEKEGLGIVQLVTPATPDARLKQLAEASRGFLYAVTITGVTGGANALPEDLTDHLDRVSAVSPLPVCAGFGIRTAANVQSVGEHAAGAIVGSALVEVLERDGDGREFLQSLLNA